MNDIRSITFSRIHFSYGAESVLKNFGMKASKGDHLVIKGESGSGKSTILKLMLGFIRPDAGSIQIDAAKTDTAITPHGLRQHTAWLPQDLDLGEGSVESVINHLFSFEINRQKKPAAEDQLGVLNQLGLDENVYKKSFRDLSTGQRQRVGIAICYLLKKPVLLLDEPTSALDHSSKQRAADLLLGNRERTVISTSHDPFWLEHATSTKEIS